MTNRHLSDRIMPVCSWLTTILCLIAFLYFGQDQEDGFYPAAWFILTIVSLIESIWITRSQP